MDKKPAAIFDIDGTFAINNGRNIFDYSKCETDLPSRPVFSVALGMFVTGFDLLIVSGREDSCLVETTRWLGKHMPWYAENISSHLFMRKESDFRDDTIVKSEIYHEHIEPFYNVEFVVDDRAKVVKMWRELGLTCLQCAPGDFDTKWMIQEYTKFLCGHGYQVISPPKPAPSKKRSSAP